MTSLDDIDSIIHAYQVGATDFVTKPPNWPLFGYRVRHMLRTSTAMQDLSKSKEALQTVEMESEDRSRKRTKELAQAKEAATAQPAKLLRYLQHIHAGGNALLRLLNNL